MEQIRSFIAIELPEDARAYLQQVQDNLKSVNASYAKWVNPDSIHLTLKFLGNVSIDKIASIEEPMQETAQAIDPFTLYFKETGAFPNLRNPRVVWVGLGGEIEKLQILQKSLESKLSALGFPPEARPFTPHLTLARLRETATIHEKQILGSKIAGANMKSNLKIKVRIISLMRSQLTRAGAIYTRLSFAELKTSCQ
jgi:2'-5' RNA ligase